MWTWKMPEEIMWKTRSRNHGSIDLWLAGSTTGGVGSCLLAWLWSLGCVMSIILLLKLYDNRPQTAWPVNVTINTTISLLTTVGKLGFVAANTAALGQLRWNWYSNPRKLSDIASFDTASRGSPIGSMQLIMKLHVRYLASIRAVVSIVAIFYISLTQQALSFPDRTVVSGRA